MPLSMLDLDNTLVDRDAAFRDAASEFLATYDLPEEDVAWLMSVDAGGYTPRPDLAKAMTERYGGAVTDADVRGFLDRGAADRVTLAEPTREALATPMTWLIADAVSGVMCVGRNVAGPSRPARRNRRPGSCGRSPARSCRA